MLGEREGNTRTHTSHYSSYNRRFQWQFVECLQSKTVHLCSSVTQLKMIVMLPDDSRSLLTWQNCYTLHFCLITPQYCILERVWNPGYTLVIEFGKSGLTRPTSFLHDASNKHIHSFSFRCSGRPNTATYKSWSFNLSHAKHNHDQVGSSVFKDVFVRFDNLMCSLFSVYEDLCLNYSVQVM